MSRYKELVLAVVDAWNRDDLAGWLATADPDVELQTAGAFPDFAPVYRGHQGLTEFWRNIREPWQTLRVDLDQVIEGDGSAVAQFRFRGEGGGSGVRADAQFFLAVKFRDRLVIRMFARLSLEQALAALEEE
jgi:ketosteroid isomerase-like protein